MPLIPHANTTYIFHGQKDDQFWLDGTLELMRRCDAIITTPDWERSSGARGEVACAQEIGMPVFHTIDELKAWLAL